MVLKFIFDYKIQTPKHIIMTNQYAIVELEPFFIVDGNDFIFDISTGNTKTDQLVKSRIKKDYTRVKSILYDPYKTVTYNYDPKTNIITLKVKCIKGKWTISDAKKMNDDQIDPYDTGPDTWMEGDIQILSKKELVGTKYAGKDGVELGVIARKIDVPSKVSEVSTKLNKKVAPGEIVDITKTEYGYHGTGGHNKKKPKNHILDKKYISNGEDLDSFAKAIGWFDKEPSEYTGVGSYKTRKAPSAHAKEFALGTKRMGLDGNEWAITKTKNGVKRWTRL